MSYPALILAMIVVTAALAGLSRSQSGLVEVPVRACRRTKGMEAK